MITGWVLGDLLQSNSSSLSTCFKANFEQDYELACQDDSWYDTELDGAYKHFAARSSVDPRSHEIFETTSFHNGERYDVGILGVADNIHPKKNCFSSLMQLNSLGKRLPRDTTLTDNYARTISEDLGTGYLSSGIKKGS